MNGSSLVPERCIFIETSRYNDMYLRPYTTNYDQSVERSLEHYTDGGRDMSAAALARVANTFLRPASVPVGTVGLIEGFNEKRFSIMLEVRHHNSRFTNGAQRTVVTGYTDHLGVISSGGGYILDPEMSIFINSIYTVRDSVINTPHGRSVQSAMSRSVQLPHVSASQQDIAFSAHEQPTFMSRPEDVAAHLQLLDDPTMVEFNRGAGSTDCRSMVSSTANSRRSNNNRNHYMSTMIRGYRSAVDSIETFGDENIWDKTRSNVREQSVTDNDFISQLMMETSFGVSSSFTYGELCGIFGSGDAFDNLVDVHLSGKTRSELTGGVAMYQNIDSDDLGAATNEAMAGTMVHQSIGGIMSDCLITSVSFIAHNDTLTGEVDFRITAPPRSFSEHVDIRRIIDNVFIPRVMNEIISDVSMDNQLSFSLECTFDLIYESTIQVSIDGGDPAFYIIPSFCDSLSSPVLSVDGETTQTMAEDVRSMLESLGNVSNNQRFIQEASVDLNVNRPMKVKNAGISGSFSQRAGSSIILPSNI